MFLSLEEVAMRPLDVEIAWADGTKETLSLPKLTMADFGPWLEETAQKYREAVLSTITKATKPADKAAIQAYAARQFATVEDLKEPISTPEGTDRVIRMSCAKAGLDEEKTNRFLGAVGPFDRFSLGMALSTLLKVPTTQPRAEIEASDPQTPATESGPDAGALTGISPQLKPTLDAVDVTISPTQG